jgi:NADH-quinone oxidoreductase subunit E
MANATEMVGFAELDAIVHKHNVERGALIPILQEVQDKCGYIPQVAMEWVAAHTGIGSGEIYGIATFYNMFRMEPVGENVVKVCHGTACHLLGAGQITEALSLEIGTEEGKTSADGKFTLESVRCIGCCSLAPCVMVNDQVVAKLTPQSVRKLVKNLRDGKESATEGEEPKKKQK